MSWGVVMADYTHIAKDKGTYMWVKPASFKDVVPVLVDLADNADQVASDTDEGFALRVPHVVYLRFLDYVALADPRGQRSALPDSTPVDGNVEPTVPVKKPRGRPRKNPLPEQEG